MEPEAAVNVANLKILNEKKLDSGMARVENAAHT